MSKKSKRLAEKSRKWKDTDGVEFDRISGPRLFYDEPSKDFDPQMQDTWPPTNLDLSSAWATIIVEASPISGGVRNAKWPAVFTSKGLTAGYGQKGCAAKTTSTPKRYKIVFGHVQMHGQEGVDAGLTDVKQLTYQDEHGETEPVLWHATHDTQYGEICIDQDDYDFSSKEVEEVVHSEVENKATLTKPKNRKAAAPVGADKKRARG